MTHTDNGIYYFLGNITSHILHALPLYKIIGGTFVVTSKKAAHELAAYNVPVACLDDVPYTWQWTGKLPRRIREYIRIDTACRKTTEYLNSRANVVLFYELFDYPDLTKPTRIFLTHGNMLKNYFKMHPRRLEIIEQYSYMAALGPYMKQEFLRSGINENKLINIGIARTDDVAMLAGKVSVSGPLKKMGVPDTKPIVSYMPTFWGDSSVEKLGLRILEKISDDYTVLFRPHPQTPKKIIDSYREVLLRKNVYYLPESGVSHPSLLDVYAASSIIIGDVSSVMLEAMLLDKPLLFADPDSHTNIEPHNQLEEIQRYCGEISLSSVHNINEIIADKLKSGVNYDIWNRSKEKSFYYSNGGSANAIAEFIASID